MSAADLAAIREALTIALDCRHDDGLCPECSEQVAEALAALARVEADTLNRTEAEHRGVRARLAISDGDPLPDKYVTVRVFIEGDGRDGRFPSFEADVRIDWSGFKPAPAVTISSTAKLLRRVEGGTPYLSLQGYFPIGSIIRSIKTGEAMQVLKHCKNGSHMVKRGIGSMKPKSIPRGTEIMLVAQAVQESWGGEDDD